MKKVFFLSVSLILLFSSSLIAMGQRDENTITLYSGRSESLVEPLVKEFESQTGIPMRVRYGGTSELAVLLAEEGTRTPADVFWAQDAGGLGAAAKAGILLPLPEELFANFAEVYISKSGLWTATSGRARLYAYSHLRVIEDEHPDSVFDLTDSRFYGRVGWAPTNGSFQAFVTAMRVEYGDNQTETWLKAMKENNVQAYRNNTALVEAVAAGEIDFSLVNNYYLSRFTSADEDFPVSQRFFSPGDIGNMVNTSGAGITAASKNRENALKFIVFLLSTFAQDFFANELNEYPILDAAEISALSPIIALDSLDDLEGTLSLMRRAGLL